MTARMTVFTATLVQESALSVSGLDRESTADQPFALVEGVPTLVGRGLKGAAVAMARRCFAPLPRSVSEDTNTKSGYRRSAWEFANATPEGSGPMPCLRAGVGIRHKTGARAGGVLYDREVVPADTRWPLVFRVDCSIAGEEAAEAEGILGYVLKQHWAQGRCWLGGGVARGLGWCRIENLQAYHLDPDAYEQWVESGRKQLPAPLSEVPIVAPTRSWCFRTLDLTLSFGEYRPQPDDVSWGVDMLSVGPHDAERTVQVIGDGAWARPSWATTNDPTPDVLNNDRVFLTDRALLMDGGRPLLPGSSVRGPLRHAFTRIKTAMGQSIQDPHPVQGKVDAEDAGGKMFGTVKNSSRILIRDGRADRGWAAARLHMHAEDEFSAGSYGSAKRDAVRLLRGNFPIRIVVEGSDADAVEPLVADIDHLVALGALGHLPVGGHKTRGAGWGRWTAESWRADDVRGTRIWTPRKDGTKGAEQSASSGDRPESNTSPKRQGQDAELVHVRPTLGPLTLRSPTLDEMAALAREALGERSLVAWWCEPTIDLALAQAPPTFGRQWPAPSTICVDEVAFFADRAVWRAARMATATRYVLLEEVEPGTPGAVGATAVHTPARLHGGARFAVERTDQRQVLLREWHNEGQILGFTLTEDG